MSPFFIFILFFSFLLKKNSVNEQTERTCTYVRVDFCCFGLDGLANERRRGLRFLYYTFFSYILYLPILFVLKSWFFLWYGKKKFFWAKKKQKWINNFCCWMREERKKMSSDWTVLRWILNFYVSRFCFAFCYFIFSFCSILTVRPSFFPGDVNFHFSYVRITIMRKVLQIKKSIYLPAKPFRHFNFFLHLRKPVKYSQAICFILFCNERIIRWLKKN